MERRRKPTVINLREHLHHTSTKTTATTFQHAGQVVESSSHLSRTLENCETFKKVSMTSEPDEELSNDFKWLIGFDLRTVFLYDIEGNGNEYCNNQEASETTVCDKERLTNFKESSSKLKECNSSHIDCQSSFSKEKTRSRQMPRMVCGQNIQEL
ncbi:fork-head domain-containing protein [Trichonephila clavipes]|nr:fork-head domain-containing protein [Trichonephila clavipes]